MWIFLVGWLVYMLIIPRLTYNYHINGRSKYAKFDAESWSQIMIMCSVIWPIVIAALVIKSIFEYCGPTFIEYFCHFIEFLMHLFVPVSKEKS